jgi:pilus assembly protein CpaD
MGIMSQDNAIHNKGFAFRRVAARIVLATAVATLISGCATNGQDGITVGSVPDDYRTNHPITIQEREATFDLVVAGNANAPTSGQLRSVDGFLASYQKNGSGPVTLLLPLGSSNQSAAGIVGRKLAKYISGKKAGHSGVTTVFYHAQSDQDLAPIRIAYRALVAGTNQCGQWPKDLTDTKDNKHYENFGCAYQNNLAAQIANPNDLQGPRKESEIDATNRSRVIGTYQSGDAGFSPDINY